jgi:D-inositol-3-phosphate glycosyltransferase
MKTKVFFLDPQSYSNLAVYDYSLLEHNDIFDITVFGNILYSYKKFQKAKFIPLFHYSECKNKYQKALNYFYSCLQLMLRIWLVRPKLIHIQWAKLLPVDYFFLKIIKKTTNIKVVYTAHNVLPHEAGENEFLKYKKYYDLVDAIIAHTERSKSELKSKFNLSDNKVFVIPHGVLDYDLELGTVMSDKIKFYELFSLKDKIVFSVLGQQSFYKGSDIIAKVWAETPLLHNFSKFRLLILGKNNNINFSEIENIDNVFIDDRLISDEEFNAILRLTDVLVLPYRAISQSGVLLSAINESVPVLVSDVGGLLDPLSIADIGWNMGEASFENLQKKIIDIVSMPDKIYEKKNNKIEWDKVRKYYAWDGIAKKTFELYSDMLKS